MNNPVSPDAVARPCFIDANRLALHRLPGQAQVEGRP